MNINLFEKNFSKFQNAKYCIALHSGTDAISLILKALNINSGDEVLTTANTFYATAEAIHYCGATPVFIDIEKTSFNMDPNKIEEKITKKTKAIVVVHMYGYPANILPILDIAKKHDLHVIEDACQSHGASINNIKVGNFGIAGAFSFFPSKILGACGVAGAVVTNNLELYKKILSLSRHGSSEKNRYKHDYIGWNARMNSIQAGILNLKLPHVNQWIWQRRENAKLYNNLLNKNNKVIIPFEKEGVFNSYYSYVIKTKERKKLIKILENNKIEYKIQYPLPIHKQKPFKKNHEKYSLINTEEVVKEIISLPIHESVRSDQIEFICKVINEEL